MFNFYQRSKGALLLERLQDLALRAIRPAVCVSPLPKEEHHTSAALPGLQQDPGGPQCHRGAGTTARSLSGDRFCAVISLFPPSLQRRRPVPPHWPQPQPRACDASLKFNVRVACHVSRWCLFLGEGQEGQLMESLWVPSDSCRLFFRKCQVYKECAKCLSELQLAETRYLASWEQLYSFWRDHGDPNLFILYFMKSISVWTLWSD